MQAQENFKFSASYALKRESWSQNETRRFYISAGAAYGLVVGLCTTLLTWGRDALLLMNFHAEFAWVKLLIGLPMAILLCCLAGWLAARKGSTAFAILVWALVGGLLGYLAGRLPYESGNLAAWLREGRLWGETIFPYGRAGAVLTTISAFVGVIAGAVLGGMQGMVLDWAWDRSKAGKKMSLGSWAVMLACVPVVLLFALTIDGQVNNSLRESLRSVDELIQMGLSETEMLPEERGYHALRPFIDRLTSNYTVQLVHYDPDALMGSYIDISFDNGLILRCATARVQTASMTMHQVLSCLDFSTELTEWVEDLVFAGLYGQRRWLAHEWQKLVVSDSVVTWLRDHKQYLNEDFEARKDGQQGEWIFISTRFPSGFEMVCRFQGVTPLVVEECQPVGAVPTQAAAMPEAASPLLDN